MKNAIITGASQGLGRAIATLLAKRRYALTLNARREDKLNEVVRDLSRFTAVQAVPGDVSEIAEQIAERAFYRYGDVDILINNASELGPLPMPRLDEYPWEDLMHVFRVNVAAPVHLSQLVLPRMKARRSGVIVNIISDAGLSAYPGWGGYGMSKAALEHASRTFAAELEGTGVRVFAVDPGDMDTEMHRLAIPDADVSQLARPEDVAPRIVAMMEEESIAA